VKPDLKKDTKDRTLAKNTGHFSQQAKKQHITTGPL